jgi:glycine hydroxymethyltransferase
MPPRRYGPIRISMGEITIPRRTRGIVISPLISGQVLKPNNMSDFLVRGDLAAIDPEVANLVDLEHARQMHKLVMIASESYVPESVREAEGSVFQNIYAEGYPHADMRTQTEAALLDYDTQLPFFRRNGDRRYYKGVEYCNVIEALAQRRGAEVFCPPHMKPEELYLNVQPLAGAVANTAIYEALVQPGDTVMTLDLLHGGHLSHGSPVNITGHRQKIVHYRVSEETEVLDYEEIMELAQREKPKMIIAGYTSYPYAPDFEKFRAIADSVGAYLLADIAHTAGMATAGAYPNPVGIAHVTSFTTHKTLMGPRGAIIITTDPEIAKKIDRAVFPGMQGGPHMNKVAGMATMFKIAQTAEFKTLQHQIKANAAALAQGFKDNGIRVVHGGTNTHMVLIDCKSAARNGDDVLMGDVASRICDLIDVVCNRNTIPGDRDAARPSALRFGVAWITQRGLREDDMHEIAGAVSAVLKSAKPYSIGEKKLPRARVDFDTLLASAARIAALVKKAGSDAKVLKPSYPHFWHASTAKLKSKAANAVITVSGPNAEGFLNVALRGSVSSLNANERMNNAVLKRNRKPLIDVIVSRSAEGYALALPTSKARHTAQWLRALSDGYVIFDDTDIGMTIPGPVVVTEAVEG